MKYLLPAPTFYLLKSIADLCTNSGHNIKPETFAAPFANCDSKQRHCATDDESERHPDCTPTRTSGGIHNPLDPIDFS